MEEIKFLILTILVELPVALLLLKKEDWRRVVLVVIGVNMVSHPIAWQLIEVYWFDWLLVEIGVAVFEGLTLAVVFSGRKSTAFFTGLLMNIVTALIGYFIF